MDEKQYYYLNGSIKMGPFSLETLKHAPIKPDTLVWNNTLSDWVEARTLSELQVFFVVSSQNMAPPIPQANQNQQAKYSGEFSQQYNRFNTPPPMPESYMVWGILTLIFCFWPLSIVSIINASKVSSCYYMGDYEGARRASEEAKKWATWSALTLLIIIGIIIGVFFIFYIFIVLVAGASVLGNAF